MRYNVRFDQNLQSRMRGDPDFSRRVDASLGPAQDFPSLVIKVGERRGLRPHLDNALLFSSGIELFHQGGCGNGEFCEKFRNADRVKFEISFDFTSSVTIVTAVFFKKHRAIYVFRVRFGMDGRVSLIPSAGMVASEELVAA